ncbi:MAG: hypothetical protein JJU03_03575 [Idiomarina sp.]|nr:hypothetical protein [Idiomarina sp.]
MNEMISHVYQLTSLLGVGTALGIGLSLSMVAPAAAAQPPHQYERTLTLQVDDIEHLHSRLGDGPLRVVGGSSSDQIEVRALIFYYQEDDIVLSLENINGEARLEGGFVGGNYSGADPFMEVEIHLPAHFSADIRHGDGAVNVNDLDGMVTIETGSGDIHVENVGGVRIEHRSGGKVQTRNIRGPVRVSQRS